MDYDDDLLLELEDPGTFPLALNFVHRRLIGGAIGFLTGGIPGAAVGALTAGGGGGEGGGRIPRAGEGSALDMSRIVGRVTGRTGGFRGPQTLTQSVGCPPGTSRIGSACVNLPFRGAPGVGVGTVGVVEGNVISRRVLPIGGTGVAVQGAFGLPATVPDQIPSVRLKCPGRMVLAIDDLCYPKSVLPRRSLNRKWRGAPRPIVSNKTMRALKAQDDVGDALERLAESAGYKKPVRKGTGTKKKKKTC